MDEAAAHGDVGQPPAAPAGGDRVDELELLVHQLTSRLAGWVEAQLVQAVDDRRHDVAALRSELQASFAEQMAGVRADAVGPDVVEQRAGQVLAAAREQNRVELAAAEERHRVEMEALRAEMTAGLAGPGGVSSAGEVLEQRVRSAMSRLSDSVEGRLAEVAELRRSELEQVAAMTTGLGQRLEEVATRVAAGADDLASIRVELGAGPDRVEAFEQRVKAAMSRLTDSMETRLTQAVAERGTGLEVLRAELVERLAEVERQASGAGEGLAALQLSVHAGDERSEAMEQRMKAAVARLGDTVAVRTDGLEERVKAAVGRLAESVEDRLGVLKGELEESAVARLGEARTEIATAVADAHQRFVIAVDQLQERMNVVADQSLAATSAAVGIETLTETVTSDGRRIEALEAHTRLTDSRLGEVVDAKLGEAADRRRADLDALGQDVEESLARQLQAARTEIGTAVADAHRRFVISVDQLQERMNVVADQSAAAHSAAGGLEHMQEVLAADASRIEALELHTRRTDARLGEVVQAKLSELAVERDAKLEQAQDELRAALDAHLAETRAEVTLVLGEARTELIQGAAEVEERRATLDRQAAQAVAGLEALGTSVEDALREAEERLAQSVEAKLAAFEALAASLDDGRTETAATMASVTRKVARVQDQVQKRLAAVLEQVEGMARAASTQAGTLAPLRSDLRLLQAQVSEMAAVIADLPPRRKPPITAAKKSSASVRAPAGPAPVRKVAATRVATRKVATTKVATKKVAATKAAAKKSVPPPAAPSRRRGAQ